MAQMRHVLSLFDLTTAEIRRVLELADELKQRLRAGDRPALLGGYVMGLLFEKPSLRTRVSFESLIGQLGGNSLFLGSDVGWGTREPIQDFLPILTSYLDLLVIRAKSHLAVEEAANYARCPVINGLTDLSHPCQALADIMTVRELSSDFEQTKIAYLGDSNNVAYSLAVVCSKLGVRLSIASPPGYDFDGPFVRGLNAEAGAAWIEQVEDPYAAVADAEFIYTDVWTSMGQEAESKIRLKALAAYQVNSSILAAARPEARLLHCLPARRGEEVVSEIIDSPVSAIVEQAENRLHAQKGLVVWLLKESWPKCLINESEFCHGNDVVNPPGR